MRQTTRLVLIVVWTSIFLSACFSNHSEIPPSKPTIESISGMTYSEIVAREKEKDRQNVILPVNTIVPTHETLAPEKQTEHPAPGIIDMISDDSLTKFISPIVAFTKGDYVPTNLITITNSNSLGTSSETMLRKEALDSLVKLADAFHKQFGKKILVVSGYRSYEYQLGIEKRAPECIKDGFCARAGHSEHQSGLAMDLFETTTIEEFLGKPQLESYFEWLRTNAPAHGFTNSYQKGVKIDGYHEEPWHWRYVGVELASELQKRNLSFTEYFKSLRETVK